MKRQLIIGAAVLLGATFAHAETIAWWLPNWDEKPARAIVADYETANPGEKVEIVITTWDTMAQKILVGLQQSHNAPDVITELESRTLRYARKNLLADLTDVVNKLGKVTLFPRRWRPANMRAIITASPFGTTAQDCTIIKISSPPPAWILNILRKPGLSWWSTARS